jgi:hypothetical protein
VKIDGSPTVNQIARTVIGRIVRTVNYFSFREISEKNGSPGWVSADFARLSVNSFSPPKVGARRVETGGFDDIRGRNIRTRQE